MKVHLDRIGEEGLRLEAERDPLADDVLARMDAAGECRFTAPLAVSVELRRVGDLIEMAGRVATGVHLACDRCLAGFDRRLASEFRVHFGRRATVDRCRPVEGVVELSAEEVGVLRFEGDELDLGDALREEVLAALPGKPLCRSDCRGLCPQCGVDRNRGGCDCRAPRGDPRLSALENLKLPAGKEEL